MPGCCLPAQEGGEVLLEGFIDRIAQNGGVVDRQVGGCFGEGGEVLQLRVGDEPVAVFAPWGRCFGGKEKFIGKVQGELHGGGIPEGGVVPVVFVVAQIGGGAPRVTHPVGVGGSAYTVFSDRDFGHFDRLGLRAHIRGRLSVDLIAQPAK